MYTAKKYRFFTLAIFTLSFLLLCPTPSSAISGTFLGKFTIDLQIGGSHSAVPVRWETGDVFFWGIPNIELDSFDESNTFTGDECTGPKRLYGGFTPPFNSEGSTFSAKTEFVEICEGWPVNRFSGSLEAEYNPETGLYEGEAALNGTEGYYLFTEIAINPDPALRGLPVTISGILRDNSTYIPKAYKPFTVEDSTIQSSRTESSYSGGIFSFETGAVAKPTTHIESLFVDGNLEDILLITPCVQGVNADACPGSLFTPPKVPFIKIEIDDPLYVADGLVLNDALSVPNSIGEYSSTEKRQERNKILSRYISDWNRWATESYKESAWDTEQVWHKIAQIKDSQTANVMTWVPAYKIGVCETRLTTDIGGIKMTDGLTHLALQYWVPDPSNGSIKYVFDHLNNADVLRIRDMMREAGTGIKTLLCVYNSENDWDWSPVAEIINDPVKRTNFVNSLVNKMEDLDLDGVEVDLEGKKDPNTDGDKTNFMAFMEELVTVVQTKGKEVTISTSPNKYNQPNQTWWNELIDIGVSGINSMGYEGTGIHAPDDWATYSAQKKAIDEPNKLMLGMPTHKPDGWLGDTVYDQVSWTADNGVGLGLWDCSLTGNYNPIGNGMICNPDHSIGLYATQTNCSLVLKREATSLGYRAILDTIEKIIVHHNPGPTDVLHAIKGYLEVLQKTVYVMEAAVSWSEAGLIGILEAHVTEARLADLNLEALQNVKIEHWVANTEADKVTSVCISADDGKWDISYLMCVGDPRWLISLTAKSSSPVNLVIYGPGGEVISKTENTFTDANYNELDIDGDGDLNDIVAILNGPQGDYSIKVIPEPGALPTDTYSLEVSINGETVILAQDEEVGNIPPDPYVVKATHPQEIAVDIKPASCPNPVNANENGGSSVLPAAVLGTNTFDVTNVNVASIRLAGIPPLRSSIKDVATPYEPLTGKTDVTDCNNYRQDSYPDLNLKFNKQVIINAVEGLIGRNLQDGDVFILPLIGKLQDGTNVRGDDVILVKRSGKNFH